MSKPISIAFGSSKSSSTSKPSTSKPFSLNKPLTSRSQQRTSGTFHDSDSEDERAPIHESVSGFDSSAGGAISALPPKDTGKTELVIESKGNYEWYQRMRSRQKSRLPAEVQTQMANGGAATVERDEVSKASGLQFVHKAETDNAEESKEKHINGSADVQMTDPSEAPKKPLTDDERALQALLGEANGERTASNLVIEQREAEHVDEVSDFRADVASRPDSATLEDYAAIPVEEFGMAMLRGMGKKRKANGLPVNHGQSNTSDDGKTPKLREARAGYLGLGAKGVPNGAEVELGAWGKAALRKNKKGEGLYTPVLLKNTATGEMITEEEMEARKAGTSGKGAEDWRDRRDRNLEKSGRGRQDDTRNGHSSASSATRDRSRSRDRSRREKDDHRAGNRDRDRDRARDRRDKDRDRDRYRDGDRDGDRIRDRSKDRKDRYRDDDRYDSSSSRRSGHRDKYGDRYNMDDDRRRRDRY